MSSAPGLNSDVLVPKNHKHGDITLKPTIWIFTATP